MDGPPFFIVGSGRSGTTLLRFMLVAGGEVTIPPESRFIPALTELWPELLERGGPNMEALAKVLAPQLREMGLPAEKARERLLGVSDPSPRAAITAIFTACAESDGRQRWGDKTPSYADSIPVIADLFPDARFIHLIRDGRDVALSYRDQRFGPRSIWGIARRWRKRTTSARAGGALVGMGRYMEVRYEELVAEPESALRRACGFLELGYSPAMLSPPPESGLTEREKLSHTNLGMPPTKGLRDWRTQMDRDDEERFEAVAGPLLSELGYETRHPHARTALLLRARATEDWLGFKDALLRRASRRRKVRRVRRAMRETRWDERVQTAPPRV